MWAGMANTCFIPAFGGGQLAIPAMAEASGPALQQDRICLISSLHGGFVSQPHVGTIMQATLHALIDLPSGRVSRT